MNYNQKQRFHKIFYENIYLLDLDKMNKNFTISGSTANVYKCQIVNNKIKCDCPDNNGNTFRNKCVCKHCCFILCKVLKLMKNKTDGEQHPFFERLYFTDEELVFITNQISTLNIYNENNDYINHDLCSKFTNINMNVDNDNNNNKINIFAQTKKTTDDDCCVICFDNFSTIDNVECPTCHNIVHKKCMDKWMEMNKKNCVYCRSDIWSKYSYSIKSKTKPKKNNYVNLST
jgi:hypothetical protein